MLRDVTGVNQESRWETMICEEMGGSQRRNSSFCNTPTALSQQTHPHHTSTPASSANKQEQNNSLESTLNTRAEANCTSSLHQKIKNNKTTMIIKHGDRCRILPTFSARISPTPPPPQQPSHASSSVCNAVCPLTVIFSVIPRSHVLNVTAFCHISVFITLKTNRN